MRKIDFFVIGAMKAGTTSLHYYLRENSALFLPVEKEVPFFSDDKLFERGLEWYLGEFFSRARPGQLIGTVTPQYMTDPRVPERIHRAYPEVKLIAILRDPVARARSHYKMMVRAFNERRPFAEAMTGHYVETGEYGRVLGEYLEYFPRESLLVLFSRDLEVDPHAVLGRIYSFLGVTGPFALPAIRLWNSESDASSKRLARVAANTIHNYLRPIRPMLKKLLPERYIRRVGMWTIMYRSKVQDPSVIDVSLPRGKELELARHYLTDLTVLEAIAGEEAPWRKQMEVLARDD